MTQNKRFQNHLVFSDPLTKEKRREKRERERENWTPFIACLYFSLKQPWFLVKVIREVFSFYTNHDFRGL